LKFNNFLVDSVTLLGYGFGIIRQLRDWAGTARGAPPQTIRPNTGSGMAIDPAALPAIKRLYCERQISNAEIGRRHGCCGSAISKLARTHGWPMRRAVTVRAANKSALIPAARVKLVRTLCAAGIATVRNFAATSD